MSTTVRCCRRRCPLVGLGQHDDIVNNRLFVRVEYLGEVFVKLGLFMLQLCEALASCLEGDQRGSVLISAFLKSEYGSILSRGVSNMLSSSNSSSPVSLPVLYFCACDCQTNSDRLEVVGG